MIDGEELIHSGEVSNNNIHSLFQDLRKFRKFKQKKGKWMAYEFLKLFQQLFEAYPSNYQSNYLKIKDFKIVILSIEERD